MLPSIGADRSAFDNTQVGHHREKIFEVDPDIIESSPDLTETKGKGAIKRNAAADHTNSGSGISELASARAQNQIQERVREKVLSGDSEDLKATDEAIHPPDTRQLPGSNEPSAPSAAHMSEKSTKATPNITAYAATAAAPFLSHLMRVVPRPGIRSRA